MVKKLNIGVLSTAKIAREYVVPALHKSNHFRITAIASRNSERAKQTASDLNIQTSFDSYEKLLEEPSIDAVYIPLPNHLHVEWSIKALESGKHVLCEKPIALNAEEARRLKDAAKNYPRMKVMEAFMYRYHPRWKRLAEMVRSGSIGEIRSIQSYFSYYNTDPDNYRNHPEMGGGALMDVGCYCVSTARLLFGREPDRVNGYSDLDPVYGVDRLTSGLLSFGNGSAVFTCSTQSHNDQYVKIYGTDGMAEMDLPFNPDFTKETRLKIVKEGVASYEIFTPCNHFTLQADAFAESIINNTPPPLLLNDSIANMEVIDKIRRN